MLLAVHECFSLRKPPNALLGGGEEKRSYVPPCKYSDGGLHLYIFYVRSVVLLCIVL